MMFRSRGFTLVELMVTLAVAAVVIGIAIPNFSSQIRNNRSVTLANEFIDMMNFARTEAIKRATRVSICASNTGTDCGGEWNEGYIAFIDGTATDLTATPTLGLILKYWQPPVGGVELNVNYGTTTTSFFRYTSTGTLARISNNPLTVAAKLTGCTGENARIISVNASGQSSVLPEDC